MKAPQLFCTVVALALSVGACQKPASQAELKQSVNQTSDRIKTESAKAGEQLADGWLETTIYSKFIGDRDIKARNISVSSRDGVVTLKGHVLNESERQLALSLAKNTKGVKQVVDQLDVEVAGPPAPRAASSGTPGAVATNGTAASTPAVQPATDDARITTSIQAKYFMDDRIKGRHINVSTNGGVVTLNGEVADETERADALLLARTTEGVRRVEDSLAISAASPAPSSPATPTVASGDADTALADRITSQLSSDNQIKNAPIEVTAKNGVVSLRGTVASSAAKVRVLTLTRATDGVTQIVDRIQIAKAGSLPTRKPKK